MDKLDSKKLFEIFDKFPIDDIKENMTSYKNSFRFKLEMFIKVVTYGEQWKKSVMTLFTNSDANIDMSDMDEAGEFMLYTRAWYWVDQIELDEIACVETVKELNNDNLIPAIKKAVKYFEGKEEFEKCSFLIKLKELSKIT